MEVVKSGDSRSGVDLHDSPGEIIVALLTAAGTIRLRLGEFLERFGLTEGRHSVLAALEHAGEKGLSQTEVAEKLMQSESNVSSLIDRLHREGLVDRRWSDTDRRKRVLMLTLRGRQLIQQVESARQRWAESLFSSISATDRRALGHGMRQLLHRPRLSHLSGASTPVSKRDAAVLDSCCDPNSPHSALERMLSTLGLAGRFAEGEQ